MVYRQVNASVARLCVERNFFANSFPPRVQLLAKSFSGNDLRLCACPAEKNRIAFQRGAPCDRIGGQDSHCGTCCSSPQRLPSRSASATWSALSMAARSAFRRLRCEAGQRRRSWTRQRKVSRQMTGRPANHDPPAGAAHVAQKTRIPSPHFTMTQPPSSDGPRRSHSGQRNMRVSSSERSRSHCWSTTLGTGIAICGAVTASLPRPSPLPACRRLRSTPPPARRWPSRAATPAAPSLPIPAW